VLGGIKMKNNIDYIILVDFGLEDNSISNSDFTWNLGKVSEEEAFKLYYERLDIEVKEYKESFNNDYIYELRQYDTVKDEYLDWDMTDSKYYNKGVK
tara:strand:+ start:348 stop:638 length:291 start_codon:yes stop_codon:yes gene_type:complete